MKLNKLIKAALSEDIGSRDHTTELFIPKDMKIRAVITANEDGVICGVDIVRQVFQALDKQILVQPRVKDGQCVKKGKVLMVLSGKARGIVTAERVALNFVSMLSGVATHTRKFAEAVKPYKVKILDTRKTFPGLRLLQKYAVRMGGGYNHRMSLDEMVLIKDNHLHINKDYRKYLKLAKKYKVEVEVENLQEFKEALGSGIDMIMLDNMSVSDIKKAVWLRNNFHQQTKLEASGNISLANIRRYASTGVDYISIGSLTKDIQSLDVSMEVTR
ncbi:MAG: carboxylating nicotinate-nucleotide diphosphorylase [Candidatus Omnitrophica bacterium]|nr:carboxylating nicotinate-nucleotide diphosphorylase [Candidatus Omnitrophota bacterium]MDD5654167.1 carboxylating nicotinate-nucleotide diphosphorylase [Candidatus Omnitrophota bacterium]